MKKVLVIGDSCQDVFCYCNCSRLAPEAPVPVLDYNHEQKNPGMAYNVYENVRSLNHVCLHLSSKKGSSPCVNTECDIQTNSNWRDITKTRLVDSKTNQMFLRLDSSIKFDRIKLGTIRFHEYDAVIISDYDKGFILKEDIEAISRLHDLTFLDTKKVIGNWAEKITFIKINEAEYELSLIHI